MSSDPALDRLQVALDRAVLDASAWRDVCDELAACLGGVGTMLVPEDVNQLGPWIVASRSLGSLVEVVFREGWHLRNYRRRALPVIKQRGYATDLDIADAAAWRREPFYAELISGQKLGIYIGIHVEVGRETWIAAVQRAADAPPPNAELFSRVERVRPMLAAAVRASMAVGAKMFQEWKSFIADPSRAIFVVDRRGRVVDRNEASESYLKHGLTLKSRLLVPSDPFRERDFQDLLAMAAAGGEVTAPPVMWRAEGNRLMVADVVPINPRLLSFHSPAAALVVVRRAIERENGLADLLKGRARLSAAEIRLAQALFEGKSLAEYATDVGNTLGTVRQQLKSIFRKTQTSRQAELVTWMRRLRASDAN